MQFIFLLLGIFFIACILYGIYAGVQTIVCSATRISEVCSENSPPVEIQSKLFENHCQPSPSKSCVDELQAIFELHQSGALTKDEFNQIKNMILSSASSSN